MAGYRAEVTAALIGAYFDRESRESHSLEGIAVNLDFRDGWSRLTDGAREQLWLCRANAEVPAIVPDLDLARDEIEKREAKGKPVENLREDIRRTMAVYQLGKLMGHQEPKSAGDLAKGTRLRRSMASRFTVARCRTCWDYFTSGHEMLRDLESGHHYHSDCIPAVAVTGD